MKLYIHNSICVFFLLLLMSCSNDPALDEMMNKIRLVGDGNPQKALVMLDSLEVSVREQNEYLQCKYDLLKIRLNDKADILPGSDLMIKSLVDYFGHKGSASEKQEVYYYAGSVYRDLQDTPRAMEYFFKSLDYADDNDSCDSIMMRNTYSNLNYLYYRVQNFTDALYMAQKELEICKKTKSDLILPYMHIGASNLALKNAEGAEKAFDFAYSLILNSPNKEYYNNTIIYLIYDYSKLKKTIKAKECIAMIKNSSSFHYSSFACVAFAQYYKSVGVQDSSILFYKRILDEKVDINDMYDAAKNLYRIFSKQGDEANTNLYAGIYMQLSDSLDFGKRQELAATVNNQYQYHLDQMKEQKLNHENEKYRRTLIVVSFVAIFSVFLVYIILIKKRNHQLKEILKLSSELQRISDNEKQLKEDIVRKENELEKSAYELKTIKYELQHVNNKLSEYDKSLKKNEQLLAEKMEQNRAVINMLHQSNLEEKAEDVIQNIRESSSGKKSMASSDWKSLYQAVDKLYPSFKDRLLKELGTFTELQMQVCYLIRIGLSKPQIQNVTNMSRATVWRWVKKYDWILDSSDLNTVHNSNFGKDAGIAEKG